MNYNRATITAATERALRQQQAEREQREAAERQAQAERDRQNAAVRAAYLAGLAAQKAEKHAKHDAAVDAELAPERARLERQWRADHPESDAREFERKAWPALRANLVEAREQAQMEALRRQMQQSGRYTL